jgi:hypothetical protein
MDSATPVASPAAAGSIAQVYGENASGAPITAGPKQVIEAGMADSPLSTAAASVAFVSGTDAAGNSVRTKVQPVGTKTAGVTTAKTAAPFTTGTSYIIASVTVPETGMYSASVYYNANSIYAGGPAVGISANQRLWRVNTADGRPFVYVGVDVFTAASPQLAGSNLLLDLSITRLGAFKATAGEVITLELLASGTNAPCSISADGAITLIKVSDNDLATPNPI